MYSKGLFILELIESTAERRFHSWSMKMHCTYCTSHSCSLDSRGEPVLTNMHSNVLQRSNSKLHITRIHSTDGPHKCISKRVVRSCVCVHARARARAYIAIYGRTIISLGQGAECFLQCCLTKFHFYNLFTCGELQYKDVLWPRECPNTYTATAYFKTHLTSCFSAYLV